MTVSREQQATLARRRQGVGLVLLAAAIFVLVLWRAEKEQFHALQDKKNDPAQRHMPFVKER